MRFVNEWYHVIQINNRFHIECSFGGGIRGLYTFALLVSHPLLHHSASYIEKTRYIPKSVHKKTPQLEPFSELLNNISRRLLTQRPKLMSLIILPIPLSFMIVK